VFILMAHPLPIELWHERVAPCLPITDLMALRASSRAVGSSVITVALLQGSTHPSPATRSLASSTSLTANQRLLVDVDGLGRCSHSPVALVECCASPP